MIEAISHLIHRDYEAIVEDFVTLQFIDPGTNLTPILPVLAKACSINPSSDHPINASTSFSACFAFATHPAGNV